MKNNAIKKLSEACLNMENDLIETVLAVMANPKSCELEVFITEGSVHETMDRLQKSVAAAGAHMVGHPSGKHPATSFNTPASAQIAFRAGSLSGFARNPQDFVLVPTIVATMESDESGEVWVRFNLAYRQGEDDLPMAA